MRPPGEEEARRAGSSGPLSEIFTVNFGQNPGGGFTASVMGGMPASAALLESSSTPATASTVNGRTVQKVLPNGNGKRSKSRV